VIDWRHGWHERSVVERRDRRGAAGHRRHRYHHVGHGCDRERGQRTLLGGGGVDGAIHRAAGPQLLAECRTLGGCETGSTKIPRATGSRPRTSSTRSGRCGRAADRTRKALLAGCYRSALDLAAAHALRSIAYPAISTGIYRFPADLAARIAVGTVASEVASAPRGIAHVVFCCFASDSAEHHSNAFAELGLA